MTARTFTGHAGNLNWNGVSYLDNAIIFTNWSGGPNTFQGFPSASDELLIGFDGNFAVVLDGPSLSGGTNEAASLTVQFGSSLTIRTREGIPTGTVVLALGNGDNTALVNAGEVTIDGHDRTYPTVTLDGGLDNTGTITIKNDTSLSIAGAIENSGTIALHTFDVYFDADSYISIAAADVRLDGGGEIVMTQGGNERDAIIGWSTTETATLHNVDNTISGEGTIGTGGLWYGPDYLLALDNQEAATIEANVSGKSLTLKMVTVTNAGAIKASGGGIISVLGTPINQTASGLLWADGAGSRIDLNNTTIAGGLLVTDNDGIVNVVGTQSMLDGSTSYGAVTNAGIVRVENSEALRLKEAIHNTGTIALYATDSYIDVDTILSIAAANVTLDGGGKIVMTQGDSKGLAIIGWSTTETATLHNVDNTISGEGTIGTGGLWYDPGYLLILDNQAGGTIAADIAGESLTLKMLTVTNAGKIKAISGSGVVLHNAVLNQTGNGVLRADGAGSHIDLNGATIAGGRLATSDGGLVKVVGGSNIVDGSPSYGAVTNAGAIEVGNLQLLYLKGVIHNSGTITLRAEQVYNGDDRSILSIAAGGVTLDGGGSIVLQPHSTDHNAITGSSTTVSTTLDNVNNTISGAGTIGKGGWYYDAGDLLVLKNGAGATVLANSAGRSLVLNTGVDIVNDGLFKAAGGTLLVKDAVTGAGHAEITGGGTIRFNAAYQQDVTFGGEGHLVLANGSNNFAGVVSNWTNDDTVQLVNLAFKATYQVVVNPNGGGLTLVVVDSAAGYTGVGSVNLAGQYIGRNFTLTNSGGGTLLSKHAAGPTPVPLGLALAAASDSGAVGDLLTKFTSLAINGTGEAGDTVTLYRGATIVGTGVVAVNGTWTVNTTDLAAGAHNLTAKQTDGLGGVSAASVALSVTIDTTPPTVTGQAIVNTAFPELAGTADPNAVVTITEGGATLGTATADASGAWGFTPIVTFGVNDGVTPIGYHTLIAAQTDIAGNQGNVPISFFAGSGDANYLLGGAPSELFYGLAGDDTLNGGGGADTMIGGLGNDTYIVDDAGDTAVEVAGGGTDTVQSRVTFTLAAEVEDLVLTGTASITGTGNALNNVIIGNSAVNGLNGGDGDDTMDGGGGADAISGGAGSDTLLGGAGNDTLYGFSGNDTLNGGSGADAMDGGGGGDTYTVDNAGDTVVEAAGGGNDLVKSSLTYTLGAEVERLALIGTATIDGTGNGLNNRITGNSANNTLDGAGGADAMYGGGGADTLLGSEGNDTLNGGAGDDTLNGGTGDDVLVGSTGSDNFTFSAANLTAADTVSGGGDGDTLMMATAGAINAAGVSGVETYRLAGTAANTITLANANFAGVTGASINVFGGAGANTVDASALTGTKKLVFTGSGGNDKILAGPVTVMTGGGGTNRFTFDDIGTNSITDFGASAGNAIVLRDSGFDLGANEGLGTGSLQHLAASVIVANATGAFTTTGQRFAYNTTTGRLRYDADGSGSGFGASSVTVLADHAGLGAAPAGRLFFTS